MIKRIARNILLFLVIFIVFVDILPKNIYNNLEVLYMKTKNIIITVVLVILVVVIIAFAIINFNAYRIRKVIEAEDSQVEVLTQIYGNYISDEMSRNKYSIVLDDSTTNNIITGQKFSDENVAKLKALEVRESDEYITKIIYAKYTEALQVLTLTIKTADERQTTTLRYLLGVEDGKITYKEYDEGNIVVTDF